MLEVHNRGGFSDFNNIKPENRQIQVLDFDNNTRIRIFNLILDIHNTLNNYYKPYPYDYRRFICCEIMNSIYSEYVDASNVRTWHGAFDQLKDTIYNDSYDVVLTVIQALAQYWNENYKQLVRDIYGHYVFDLFNDLFEREYVGYRFLGDRISSISDKIEIRAIEDALAISESVVSEHISKANMLLSDRKKPDYENSIKESITAVEAMCKIITGAKGNEATLGSTLKKLEDSGVHIHGALKKAFNELYGFTNDSNGIRHAGNIGGPSATFEEAKFMLVASSAFVNYLKGLQSKYK